MKNTKPRASTPFSSTARTEGRPLAVAVAILVLAAFLSFLTTGLVVLATAYAFEFAQAVLCLLLPMLVVGWLTLRTCLAIESDDLRDEALLHRLRRHRVTVQAVGMVALLVTGMFGMYQNLTVGVFG